jgi:NMD protein affecting ribosome stability and mRNA decay
MKNEKLREALRKPFGAVAETPLTSQLSRSNQCPDCERLERGFHNAAKQIRAVVTNRYESTSARVRALRKWQDCRDRALEAFYKHKKIHPRRTAA